MCSWVVSPLRPYHTLSSWYMFVEAHDTVHTNGNTHCRGDQCREADCERVDIGWIIQRGPVLTGFLQEKEILEASGLGDCILCSSSGRVLPMNTAFLCIWMCLCHFRSAVTMNPGSQPGAGTRSHWHVCSSPFTGPGVCSLNFIILNCALIS